MSGKSYKYIYGPVPSWRLGSSLGIDLLSNVGKICTLDCLYCQLGETRFLTDERKIFVPTAEVISELDSLPTLKIDYITFSGTGEPTLAKNLGKTIEAIKKIRKEKIAVLTNSSLLNKEDVQQDLLLADLVVAKLDAGFQEAFETINKPLKTIKFNTVLKGIEDFKSVYKGRLALQIMFIDENKKQAKEIAQIALEINPTEVQINTPLRPCRTEPLSEAEIDIIESYFSSLNTITVYKAEKKKIKPISSDDTLRRRGKI